MTSINVNRNYSTSFGSLEISQNRATQKALKKCNEHTLDGIEQAHSTLENTRFIDAYIECDKKKNLNLRIKTKEGFELPEKYTDLTYAYSDKEPFNYSLIPNGKNRIEFYKQRNVPPLGGRFIKPQKQMELEKVEEIDGRTIYKIDPEPGISMYEYIARYYPPAEAIIYSKKGPNIDFSKFRNYISSIKELDDTIGKIAEKNSIEKQHN